jgi:hypothetical protein
VVIRKAWIAYVEMLQLVVRPLEESNQFRQNSDSDSVAQLDYYN